MATLEDDSAQPSESRDSAEQRFRVLVDSVKDYAIFRLDPRGVVASWNSGAERIKGYEADEIVGQHFSRFYPIEDVQAGKCELELAGAARDGRFEDEGWRVRKDGSRFWANVVITALRDSSGELVGFAKVTRDLTERRAAELEVARVAQQARNRLRDLAELAESLASALSLEEVTRAAVERGTRLAQSDTCTLHVLSDSGKTLELVAEHGCNPQILAGIRSIGPENPFYRIGAEGAEAVWVETDEQYRQTAPELASTTVEGVRAHAFACLPLQAEGRSWGMLGLGYHAARSFSDDDREFIATFARQCAQALARARRFEAERETNRRLDRLRASLSTTLRSIGDAVIATDAAGKVSMMNEVAESLTGWREADAQGQPLPAVFHIVNEQTRAIVQNPVEKVLATGGIVGLANHTVLIAKDGREVPIDDSGAPIRAEGGVIAGVVLVFRDVSQRKREETIKEFLAEATAALSQSLDYEQTVTRVARLAVPRLADWCAVDLVVDGQKQPRRLAVAHVDPQKVELAWELAAKYPPIMDAPTGVPNVLRTGRSEMYSDIPDALLVAGCRDEEELRIARELQLRSAIVVPLVVRDRVLGAMSFVFAESNRRYTEDDLRVAEDLARRCANAIENARLYRSESQSRLAADAANRAKDEFLAVVSHELRTPLNAILGWSKMLATPAFDERRKHTAIETIGRNALAMTQLLEDLLDTSRIISGKMSLQLQKVDVLRVVTAALDVVKPAAAGRDIEITTQLEDGVPAVVGDPTRLQQIVWNLLSNAIKFSPKGSRIALSLSLVGTSIQVRVADRGHGISADFLPFVFEPFRQQDASASRSYGGLGLGLAISRQLAQLHGGSITAESAGTDQGATFTLTLPTGTASVGLPDRRTPQPDRGSNLHVPAHLRGLRVLVVDDDDDARHLTASILEDCGCQVAVAGSVREAMTKLQEEPPDVLLSDIGMPEEDGFDLIRKVRALPRAQGGNVPAAAVTAYARAEDRRQLLNAGYSIHLPKPIDPAELVAVVSTLGRFAQEPPGAKPA